jgi:ubiquinone/menaquinone biosynthesis C-methylase UbiE
MANERIVEAFNEDVLSNEGYLYTTNASLSSRLANRRLTELALHAANFRGARVLDVGCGDGSYSFDVYDEGSPTSMVGIDPASNAIEIARSRRGDRAIEFRCENAEQLGFDHRSFDIAHLRGVLHHMDKPAAAVVESLRVAQTIVIIEPNGYNPVLKIIEKISPYHRKHGERSFSSRTIDRWISDGGGRVVARQWAGLVPFFCPDWMARVLKTLEPVIERIPVVNLLSCAVYVVTATRVAP